MLLSGLSANVLPMRTYEKAQDLCAEVSLTTGSEAPTQVWAGTEGEARAVRSKCTASFPDLATSRA